MYLKRARLVMRPARGYGLRLYSNYTITVEFVNMLLTVRVVLWEILLLT